MFIIGCVSQKGGVGKSVLARLLACELASSGYKAKIADMDVQQATSTRWVTTRAEAGHQPAIAASFYKTVGEALRDGAGADVLIVDGKPSADTQTTEIAKKANLIVLPSGASLDDLRPTAQLTHTLLSAGVPKDRLLVVLVAATTPATERDARQVLSSVGLRVAEHTLRKLPAYEVAMGQGLSPSEVPGRPHLREEAALVAEEIAKVMVEVK